MRSKTWSSGPQFASEQSYEFPTAILRDIFRKAKKRAKTLLNILKVNPSEFPEGPRSEGWNWARFAQAIAKQRNEIAELDVDHPARGHNPLRDVPCLQPQFETEQGYLSIRPGCRAHHGQLAATAEADAVRMLKVTLPLS